MNHLKALCRIAVLLPLLAIAGERAHADEASAGALAQNLAPAITEVANGGTWTDGKDTGFYRAVVVNEPGAAGDVAFVFMQWITYRNGTTEPRVVTETAPNLQEPLLDKIHRTHNERRLERFGDRAHGSHDGGERRGG